MQAAAELILIRHALAECRRNGQALLCGQHNVPLSDAGRVQVERLRARLACEGPFDAIYSSPLARAIDTAAAAAGPPPRTLRSLAEIACGVVDGAPIETVKHEYSGYWIRNEEQTDANFRWPGGESYTRFRRRVLRAVSGIARAHGGKRVLVFTHAGVVNQVLGSLACQSPARWSNLRPHNASITRVFWDGNGGHVDCFDDCSHL